MECLRIQKFDRPFEVVVIDNESDDGSAEVAQGSSRCRDRFLVMEGPSMPECGSAEGN
jgi:glycosyltransferase involved in cell wall biosynthesis